MSTTEAQPPKYRLIYYPFRGRGELVRILLAHLEIPYEDVRIEASEWMKQKPGIYTVNIIISSWNRTGTELFIIYQNPLLE